MTSLKSVSFAFVVLAPLASSAMTIRHDVSDTSYTSFGNSFVGVGRIGGGTGTLIAPNWVITAGHVAAGSSSLTFFVNGTSYSSAAGGIFVNPGYNSGDLGNGRDLALVRLNSNVAGVTPYSLYTSQDEIGKVGVGVGFGQTGNGLTGNTGGGGTKRAGRNMIDDFADTRQLALLADFDSGQSGDNVIGTATQMDLEFCVAPGDSGGALFIESGGQYRLAGVTSFLWWVDGTGNADYGDGGGWMRLSDQANRDWIQQVSGVPEPTTMVLLGAGVAAIAARRRKR